MARAAGYGFIYGSSRNPFKLLLAAVYPATSRETHYKYDDQYYVKHGIVNAPIKKRYMKRHVAYLFVVCILKTVYSMEEISNLISVQVEKYPQDQAYDYFCAELECCLTCIFSHKKVRHIPSDDEGSAIVDLIRNTIQSIAYTAYVRETLQERLLKVNEHPVDDK